MSRSIATSKRRRQMTINSKLATKSRQKADESAIDPTLDFGRSVRVVGPVSMRDPEIDPHAINRRGELGKPLFNWMFNTVSNDPISRMSFPTHASDQQALVMNAIGRGARGK